MEICEIGEHVAGAEVPDSDGLVRLLLKELTIEKIFRLCLQASGAFADGELVADVSHIL